MRLQELVTILKDTELKQIIVGEDDAQVLHLLNLALVDVYSNLDILQEEQIITMVDGQSRYRLQDNSVRVLQVYKKEKEWTYSEPIPLNDINSDFSVFTPQPYVLHVPRPIGGLTLSVIQSVTPPYVTKENIDILDFIIPPQLMEPIVNYCGYRAYISMNGDQQTENSSHYNRYKRSVMDVKQRGLVQYSILTNIKGLDNGFPTSGVDYAYQNTIQ